MGICYDSVHADFTMKQINFLQAIERLELLGYETEDATEHVINWEFECCRNLEH